MSAKAVKAKSRRGKDMVPQTIFVFVVSAVTISSVNSLDARDASPFTLGVPANQTCAVLWDKKEGALSRDAFVQQGRIVLRIPDTDRARKLLPMLAGESIELDLESLQALPPDTASVDIIFLGHRANGDAAYAPYSLFAEIKGCLPLV